MFESQPLSAMRTAPHCYGTWLSSGSVVATELASLVGFEWLLLDMEHGCLAEADVSAHLQAIRDDNIAAIVRVPTHDAGLIGRVLDKGSTGIMVPHVSSRRQAEAVVRAMRYPPHGARGYSRSVRAFGYGLDAPADAQSTPVPLLMVQIEDYDGVQQCAEIAAVDGVDTLFIGPADLKLDLAHRKDECLTYQQALETVNQAARRHGKNTGILVRDQTEIAEVKEAGFSRIALDSDVGILRAGFMNALGSLR